MRAWLIPLLVLLAILFASLVAALTDSWNYWGDGNHSENLRNLFLSIAIFFGLPAGVWRAYTAHQQAEAAKTQADIAQQGHFTDRFSTAVQQLGSDQMPVRLGGIYALWRLAEDSPTPDRDWVQALNILCAFVRSPPHREPRVEVDVGTQTEQPIKIFSQNHADVQAIMGLIGAEDARYRRHQPANYRLNLICSYLCGANLVDANLGKANLGQANLGDAYLRRANLSGVNFYIANLIDASLEDADLTNVQHLTQDQLDTVQPSAPPKSLPGGLVWPFEENDDGEWVRPEE